LKKRGGTGQSVGRHNENYLIPGRDRPADKNARGVPHAPGSASHGILAHLHRELGLQQKKKVTKTTNTL